MGRGERSFTNETLSRPRNCNNVEAGVKMQENSIVQLEGVSQRFSYNELSEATGGFSTESELGHGGFGVVYQAELSGIHVAIKRMNPEATQSQGMKEFKSEIKIISQVSHRNLINLRGHCADEDRKEYMLVYDLMPNGSLDDALFEGTTHLSWPQKFKIVTGTADGLAYLHQGFNQQVIHRDIKCSNILLDREWNAKLGDFGISRMVAHEERAKTTDMAGTLGYIAPEVYSEYQFTDKADVYAFGVVVLEVACGRRVFPSPSHTMALVPWVLLAHRKGNLLSIVDERHRDDDTNQITRVLKVGLLCTQLKPQDRPTMRRVLQMLAGDVVIPTIPTLKPTSPRSIIENFFHKMLSLGSASQSPRSVSVQSPATSRWIVYPKRRQQDANLIKTLLEGNSMPRRELKKALIKTLLEGNSTLMPLPELKKATDNFAQSAQIGQGGFGRVYIGRLNDGTSVAIKRGKREGSENDKEPFLNEVRILSQVNHRHLVKLRGCCMENKIAVLVFEFVSNGTLQEHLQGKTGARYLSWQQRLNIAVQTADAIHYLHSAAAFSIIHGDVKSANILLNEDLDAKVTDFGVSRLAPLRATHVSTESIQGTIGYIDPEYFTNYQLTDKSDVYSFGVVLLELISAKPSIDFQRDGDDTSLVHSACRYIERGDLELFIDPALTETYRDSSHLGRESILNVGRLAMKCLNMQSESRPSMKQVLKYLEKVLLKISGTAENMDFFDEL